MKGFGYSLVLFGLFLIIGFCMVSACGDDDDDDSDMQSVEEICSDLGELPVDEGTMSGAFSFDGGSTFPLTIDLNPEDNTWNAYVEISDASNSFEGTCGGDWDANAFLNGECYLSGSFDLHITLTGQVGNKAACGDWTNDAGQSGDFWVSRQD